MYYFVKTPWYLKKVYRHLLWDIPNRENVMYLTFDDGPHPTATPFVLDQLKKYNARATFFCVGRNVQEHPALYRRLMDEGHSIGNHTHNHVNGWQVSDDVYFNDIIEARKYIDSSLFRPPYGRITMFQARHLRQSSLKFKVVMWDVVSGDFDTTITPEKCTSNVLKHSGSGSIVVFHDSEKAFPNLKQALPATLEHFSVKGYRFEAITV
ncbi:MAG TPA: polysaccharide deacetylase family protein [Chitinophagaceae bacterium]|nr:polysaccharide deacetylase family protein [Chitinophagaceae bacterium]